MDKHIITSVGRNGMFYTVGNSYLYKAGLVDKITVVIEKLYGYEVCLVKDPLTSISRTVNLDSLFEC